MRTLVFTGLILPFSAGIALAQTPPLVPAPPLTALPTTPATTPSSTTLPTASAPPTLGTTTTGTNEPPVDYPGAIWIPAAEGNFDYENRPAQEPIDMVVVHDIEGPASAGIDIFQTKGKNVSSHYIVGGDGKVYQLVREKNVGYHAGNRVTNHRSIGIETHGYAYRAGWYNTTIYEAEAKLIRDITTRYGIARDRSHIIGHFEVPHPTDPTKFGGRSGHTDPGPYWDWATFMTLIRNDAKVVSATVPPVIHPGETLPVAITLQNSGDDAWPANTSRKEYVVESTGPVVYLSTLAGKESPLFNLKSWVSPVAAAGTADDVRPGASATYNFTITGPTQLGLYTEPMRLSTMPKIAQGGKPVSFGDTVSLSTRVVPYDVTVSAVNPLPAPDPTTAAPPLALWTASVPLGGIYAMYALPTPPTKKIKGEEKFVYRVSAADGEKIASFSRTRKMPGTGSAFLGYCTLPRPTGTAPNVTVRLVSAPKGTTATSAGSLRLVGPFPFVPEAKADAPDFGVKAALNMR